MAQIFTRASNDQIERCALPPPNLTQGGQKHTRSSRVGGSRPKICISLTLDCSVQTLSKYRHQSHPTYRRPILPMTLSRLILSGDLMSSKLSKCDPPPADSDSSSRIDHCPGVRYEILRFGSETCANAQKRVDVRRSRSRFFSRRCFRGRLMLRRFVERRQIAAHRRAVVRRPCSVRRRRCQLFRLTQTEERRRTCSARGTQTPFPMTR